ncbi:hypothetical protein PR202_ga27944 [Eleusine coracana subsp. coracana]|uniref:Pentatricopeptide repeat-containing protein n=1 Tax=Eleusine coracana subsp. coracana TaxID=191504 RepID=A0AAV5DIZ3_ELECO|nr:hypothetical protein PR202_ga27944 [Eleusine coracana subsp. coracana]
MSHQHAPPAFSSSFALSAVESVPAIMWRNASLRLWRDGGYQLSSQRLPVGYSENLLHLIRKFCSASTESFSNSKVIDEFPDQDATDMSHFDSEASPCDVIGATNKGFKKQRTKNGHGTKANISVPRASPDTEEKFPDRAFQPSLFQIVLDTPRNFLTSVFDKWIQNGNRLERDEVLRVLFHLRKQRMYSKALQFVEWIYRGKLLNFEEQDYCCHLDLIARNHGIEAARKYMERVPKPFRSEVLYETLLASCVCLTDVQKAEDVFKEIRNCSLPLTVSACNQMLLLYKRVARTKVADILMLMEKENVKPSLFTYKLLIDLKQRSNDTLGMEAVLDTMKANGAEPDVATQAMVAKFYISGGLTAKSEEVIRVMEVYKSNNRHAFRSLLDLYAILGRPNDVAKIWKLCVEPNLDDHLAAIEAWGKLGHIEQAEEILEALLKTTPRLTSKYVNAMLNVYAENKLLAKGKNFLERMCSAGCPSGPLTWDAIVSLYVNSGEVAMADSFLLKVAEKNPDRNPLFRSYIKLLKAFAEKGDIHNAEKIFDSLKKLRYPGRTPPYEFLLGAYVNAKVQPMGSWRG